VELYHACVGFMAIPISPAFEYNPVVIGNTFFLCGSIRESRLFTIVEPFLQNGLEYPCSVCCTPPLGLL